MKVIKTIWISSMSGTGLTGIVLIQNEMGKCTARIGQVNGMNEELDIKNIIDYGSKFRLEDAQAIVEHLKK